MWRIVVLSLAVLFGVNFVASLLLTPMTPIPPPTTAPTVAPRTPAAVATQQ